MDTQKRIIIWFSAALVIAIAAIGAYQLATQPLAEVPHKDGTLSMPINASDWTKGSKTPKATLLEYGDFQCPACGAYYPMVEEVFTQYKDRISFTFRHFPLSQHQNAVPAAYASEAAGVQGKFWEMYDLLYKNQTEWSESTTAPTIFEGYAQKLGLDMAKYKIDVNSDAVKARVESSKQSGVMSSLDHTPTFFLNGKMATNPTSKAELIALIDYAIAHP